MLNGGGGHDDRVLAQLQEQPYIHKLVRPKLGISIFKHRLQPSRPGCLVNLIVDCQQAPGCQLSLVVATISLNHERSRSHMLRDRRQLILWQRKENGNRLQLGDDQHRICVGSVHDVARVDESNSYAPRNRRGNVAIGNLQLSVGDLRIVISYRPFQLIDQCALGIDLLLRDRARLLQ